MQLFFWAVIFRLVGCMGVPLLEDDFYRYLWDGYRFFENGSPYGVPPSVFFGDTSIPQTFINILAQVNYPQVPTIYGPTLEYSFLLSHLIAPAEVWPLQWLYSVVDLALIALLLRMAKPRWVLLYAWSPLVIKELAFTAHPDGLGVFFLMAAVYCRQRHWFKGAAVTLALSVGAKIFALLLVPFVLWRMPWHSWLLFVMALAALYMPFVWYGATDVAGLWVFARDWQFNSSVYALTRNWFDPMESKIILGLIFCCVYFVLFWRHTRSVWQLPRGDLLFGVFFLLAPVVNAWYLIWLLPFAVIYPHWWSWSASYIVLLSYLTGINFNVAGVLSMLHLPWWAKVVEYGLVLLAGLRDLVVIRRRGQRKEKC
ncbi:MAG: hypothetical protein EP323_05480 [Gammaproteobacteria bacterium]|nr:MAG: hypothetical protein EP323_05480 [Gammaproteobacteria bacterium]